jgi:prepilin-type processing-associated H-X9-DG protein
VRPSETILVAESNWPNSQVNVSSLWDGFIPGEQWCEAVFTHPAGKVANFVFFDGHVGSKKWLATLYPLEQNNWEAGDPRLYPGGRALLCTSGEERDLPSDPSDPRFQRKQCLKYQ